MGKLQTQMEQFLKEHPEFEKAMQQFMKAWLQNQRFVATVTVS